MAFEPIKNYIDGKLIPPVDGQYLDNFCPFTGKVYGKTPQSSPDDAEQAIQAAARAFPLWSTTSSEERARFLREMARLIRHRLPQLAEAESLDNGKPLQLAQNVDIPRSAQNFEFFADAISQDHSESFTTDTTAINMVRRSPLGVVTCISPWNLPLYLLSWKIAPALATGNTVVAKPSEVTPLTASLLSEICIEAGLPPGVLNILHGEGAPISHSLTTHPLVKAVSFTGSTATGRAIYEQSASTFKKVSLEMGGKNATIVFADCDYERTLDETLRAAFANQGQICLCGSRIFIEASLYDRFKSDLVEKAKKLKVGHPQTPGTRQGALVSKAHYEKVLAAIELAKQEGGTVLCGGKPAEVDHPDCKEGWFVEPTLIEGLDSETRTNQEEIFGPVATLIPFHDIDELISQVNATEYGLASSVWTQNLDQAQTVAERIESGIVWINCWMIRDLRTPFGGVKNSGLGREGGKDALRFYTEPKNICIRSPR